MNDPIVDLIPNDSERLLMAAEDVESGNVYEFIASLYAVDADALKALVLARADS